MNFIYFVLIWNIVVFVFYAYDKLQAKRSGYRISEKNLLIWAFLLGAFGAMMAMILFRHKIKKTIFRIGIPLMIPVNIAMLYWIGRIYSKN